MKEFFRVVFKVLLFPIVYIGSVIFGFTVLALYFWVGATLFVDTIYNFSILVAVGDLLFIGFTAALLCSKKFRAGVKESWDQFKWNM